MIIKSVSILGCGWLGLPLAQTLQQANYQVVSSVTTKKKADEINAQGITCETIQLPLANNINANTRFWQNDALIIAIPPKFKQGETRYPSDIKQVINFINQRSNFKLVMLISSTGVYPELNQHFDEQTPFEPETQKQQLLLTAEQTLKAFKQQTIALRLGGLVNEQRHPGRWFAGKIALKNGDAWVNMIHQQDVIGIIQLLLQQHQQLAQHSIVNGVSQTSCNKKRFYQQASQQLGLTMPEYLPVNTNQNQGKHIVSATLAKLNYQWQYPDLLSWLQA